MWLWLDTAYNMTYSRTQDGGNAQNGIIAGFGADSFYESMTLMQYEFPMFIMSSQFNISYAANVTNNGQTCVEFYTNILNMGSSADNLCNQDIFGWFNFTMNPTNNNGYFQSTLALTSIYLYHDKSPYYNGFSLLSGLSGSTIWATGSDLQAFMDLQIEVPIYNHYSTVNGNLCDSPIFTSCSASNLTYN